MIFNIPAGGKRTAVVSVYGAAGEKVTLTHSKGSVFTLTANNGSTKEIPVGTYTVKGGISGYSKTVTVDKNTTKIHAWPNNATIYYWYGYSPVGSWAAASVLPNTSPYVNNPVTPTLTVGANSVYMATTGDYARGGTIYLPKTKLSGSTLRLICSGAYTLGRDYAYLALNVTGAMEYGYSPAAVTQLWEGSTSGSINISSIAGGSYYIAISANTSGSGTDTKRSYITIHALYST